MKKELEKAITEVKGKVVEKSKDDENLEKRVDEFFDVSVKESQEINVMFLKGEELLMEKVINIDEIKNLNEYIKDDYSIRLVDIVDGNIITDIKTIDSLEELIIERKEDIFLEFGFLTVELVHSRGEKGFEFKIKLNEVDKIIKRIKENENMIMEYFFEDEKKPKRRVYQHDGGGEKLTVVDVLQGNFIVDEYDNFLCSEDGTFVVF